MRGPFKLSCRAVTRVAQHDAGAENGFRHIGQQFANHVFAEFFCARVGIVIGTAPLDGSVFRDDFIFTLARHGHGADETEPPQAAADCTRRASWIISSVPRRFTFMQLFSDLRFREAAQCRIESVVATAGE